MGPSAGRAPGSERAEGDQDGQLGQRRVAGLLAQRQEDLGDTALMLNG